MVFLFYILIVCKCEMLLMCTTLITLNLLSNVLKLCKNISTKNIFQNYFFGRLSILKNRIRHQRCSIKKVFLKISQNSLENTCARVLRNFQKHLFYRTPPGDCYLKKGIWYLLCINDSCNSIFYLARIYLYYNKNSDCGNSPCLSEGFSSLF